MKLHLLYHPGGLLLDEKGRRYDALRVPGDQTAPSNITDSVFMPRHCLIGAYTTNQPNAWRHRLGSLFELRET